MGKYVKWALVSAGLVTALYYGLHEGVAGARYIGLFYAWLLVIASVLSLASADKLREQLKGKFVPAPLFWTTGLAVLGLLLWHGYVVTAAFWLFAELCGAVVRYGDAKA